MNARSRNTKTDRICPACKGDGTVVVNTTNPFGYGPDPQCDRDVTCPELACMGGWIRWAPIDPLLILKQRRQHARCSWGARPYGEMRQRAFSPVNLPRDRTALHAMRWAA